MFKVEVRLQLYVFLAILLKETSLVETEDKPELSRIFIFSQPQQVSRQCIFWMFKCSSTLEPLYDMFVQLDILQHQLCVTISGLFCFQIPQQTHKKMAAAFFTENHSKAACNALNWPTIYFLRPKNKSVILGQKKVIE